MERKKNQIATTYWMELLTKLERKKNISTIGWIELFAELKRNKEWKKEEIAYT